MQTTAAQRNLAGWLLVREMGDHQELTTLPDAAERAYQKLCKRLAQLVTTAGSHALLARALHLATVEFPFLEGVRPCPPPEFCFDGMRERVRGVEPAVAQHGLAAILASLIGLLVTFIGEELALRLVRDVWPDVPLAEANLGTQEATT